MNILDIEQKNGNIVSIRKLLKGDFGLCQRLFQEALSVRNAVVQIQLSFTLFGMKWGNDNETTTEFESFRYYPREFTLFEGAYDTLMNTKSDWQTSRDRAITTYQQAAKNQYLPAILELRDFQWRRNHNTFGFAVSLQAFVGKGDKRLDHYFGQALKNGSVIGCELYYEGIYWMQKSGHLDIKFPSKHQSYEDFKRAQVEQSIDSYYDHDNLRHIGNWTILCRSPFAWRSFVRTKLSPIKIKDNTYYSNDFDFYQIKSLMIQQKLKTYDQHSFIKTEKGNTIDRWSKERGFILEMIIFYKEDQNIGRISVRETFEIYETFRHEEIQPIVDFVTWVLTKCGSAHSAGNWLTHIRDSPF
jgi:hypothetical protein